MFEVNHVTKRYGKTLANDDISFCVGDGEIAVLLGPNGAGKSTMIKCIVGLLRFTGNISICGYDNKTMEAKKLLSYVPEVPAVYDLLTVDEHIEFIARAYSLENYQAEAEALLERFEMVDKREKLGRELSKGMQQKLSVICAVLPHPKVIVFDEPMVGLDPHAIKQLKEIFVALKDAGTSVLISTHMLNSVENFWDSAHIMMHGKFAASMKNGEGDRSLEQLFFEITEGENQ